MNKKAPEKKIIIVGDSEVGKTSLFTRFVYNRTEQRSPTIQASHATKEVRLSDTQSVALSIWDTAGQERYRSLSELYFKEADGAIIVYDITFRKSFEAIETDWIPAIQAANKNMPVIIIVGNKSDKEDKRAIQMEEAETLVSKYGGSAYETSAIKGEGVEDTFMEMAFSVSRRIV